MKSTYYVVQTSPRQTLAKLAPHSTLGAASREWRTVCAFATEDAPRRFPRIIKVTIETKTIKDRR